MTPTIGVSVALETAGGRPWPRPARGDAVSSR
jgi:hypothetical protein